MKHLLLLFLLFGSLGARAVQLTLRVDMRQQTVSASGVHVAGNFQAAAGFAGDWNPATTLLTDADNDKVYEVTVNVPAGNYLYKFVNGNTWAGAELPPATCGATDGSGNVNRQVLVAGSAVRLPAPAFGDCSTQVRFAVNMRGQTVSRNGVHVVGNFQPLAGYGLEGDATALPLSDDNGDGIYEVQIALPGPIRFMYRFVNGSTLAEAETVPAACGTADANGTLNRVFDATAAVNTMPAVCFNTCQTCSPSLTDYTTHWWNDAVFYEVFVRSFYDSNGDGQGDFAGLTQKLDYLNDGNPATTTDLGVTGIWLMPMMESPSYHGYDVTNYKATEPDYGTMAQFEAFLAAAHARGIKVIIDLVLNHTSSQHPWFQQSAGSATSSYRDWYRWSATSPGLGWYQRNGSYYYGYFWSEMPDLNWRNPQMKAAMWDATRFWLKKGVDGYRLDAVKFLVEDGTTNENTPGTLNVLEEFHDSVRAVNPQAFTVGEAWSNTPAVVPYVLNQRLDACFEFDLSTAIISSLSAGNPAALRTQLELVDRSYPKLQYATFLSNHDQNRVMNAFGGDQARMKQAAALYLTMPGVPFLYYGEEIGMLGTGSDEDKRKPMQWTSGTNAGFSTGTPWRALNSNYTQFNVATQQADPTSLLNHYKQLIRLRNTHEVLRKGYVLPVAASATSVLSYARVYQQEATITVTNMGGATSSTTLAVNVSTLPAGSYQVTELLSGQSAGTVTLNAQGGVSNWTPSLAALGANQTWLLRLVPAQTLSTAGAHTAFAPQLFPNPAASQVRLELGASFAATSTVQVYDLQGRLLHTASFSGPSRTLNTSAWAEGVYFLRVQSGAGVSTQRLLIAR
ncbi:alpha-amylase family glycosyl hydrolase [Hymenobacter cellulosilyticus]|uniref:Alpha-amylase family glycosyl hydrolase n=1 Tax=Hymenobacter cellulosilyticus TaxID=2932248 RepID=A0A8T9Q379_9BACT|nr:alpha-amylase family glycosyl hydrolase [Hymenobacter cellulosilyticus]UOQ71495.1 alpha-amylase family glycosyl hydrolase [Hymenobacter cellulosilyticus]